ncbi:2Fe-2S iron-sulfur cluster-binding protein [Pseudonocardia sp. NPDC049635]|uniref:2Fe-2S iron-sulfur cluster-binding protein n=1 Tax=Pseudonocardia sp. NPDC049635 TaxID=3155506 RepID=UPI00340F174A
MPTVIYILDDGTREEVSVPVGTPVMKAAVANGIDGIVAECGGNLACSTCHVYVEDGWGALPALSEDEDDMLEATTAPRTEQSRLSCQLVMTPELDGLVVRVPESQV